jgi:hypothetical protein
VGCFLRGVWGFEVREGLGSTWELPGTFGVSKFVRGVQIVSGGARGQGNPGGGHPVSFPKDGINVLSSNGSGYPVGGVAELDKGSDLSLEAADEEEKPVSFAEVGDIQEERPELVGVLGDGGGLGE